MQILCHQVLQAGLADPPGQGLGLLLGNGLAVLGLFLLILADQNAVGLGVEQRGFLIGGHDPAVCLRALGFTPFGLDRRDAQLVDQRFVSGDLVPFGHGQAAQLQGQYQGQKQTQGIFHHLLHGRSPLIKSDQTCVTAL